MTDKFTSKGFAELEVGNAGYKHTVYDKMNEIIKWGEKEEKL